MAFITQDIYAPELSRTVRVRSLSAAGRLRIAETEHLPDKARQMARVLEVIRDGVTDYPFPDNAALMAFAQKYPDLTARLATTILHLTSG